MPSDPQPSGLALPFFDMSEGQLISYCRNIYETQGVGALSYESLKLHGTLYTTLYSRGLTQRSLLERLGLRDEYRAWRNAQPIRYGTEIRSRWTWERVVEEARKVQAEHGFLPPAAWWQANTSGSLVQAVYLLGKTWEDLRSALGDFQSSQFVESRNGMRWRSHPEASLSNFLFARGIEHRRGSRYPKEYEEQTGRAYGVYDMHFQGTAGQVDVEIWGDSPNGSGEAKYQAKRLGKERFNAQNAGFLGIHFTDCYSDEKLAAILEPHIGLIAPYRFERPTDSIIPSTHWSNTDELLEYCRSFAAAQPDGEFPTEGWLRKRGKWSTRPGPAYNTLSVYIKTWFGGVRQLRDLIGQSGVNTAKWDRALVLQRWKEFREKHHMTPNAMRARAARGQGSYSDDDVKEAARLVSAVTKYVRGSAEADKATGFKPYRRKPLRKRGTS